MSDKQKQRSLLGLYASPKTLAITTPVPNMLSFGNDVKKMNNIGILKKKQPFSLFRTHEIKEGKDVVDLLLRSPDYDSFIRDATVLKNFVNEELFVYALSRATLHRPDTKGIRIPPVYQVMVRKFFTAQTLAAAVENEQRLRATGDETEPVVIGPNHTGNAVDPEHRVAYLREDIAVNSHHWHWHLVYSTDQTNEQKNRKGELFYYMHRQMLARYDAARLSNGLLRVRPYIDWELPIEEGYASHLTDIDGRAYAARPTNLILADKGVLAETVFVPQLQLWRARLIDAMHLGFYRMPDATHTALDIDSLGAAVEASVSSPNFRYYGNLHNMGHNLLSSIGDPDNRYNMSSPGGVMGYVETAVRDPIFFRWHKFIDTLFEVFQKEQVAYTDGELTWSNMTVENVKLYNVEIEPYGGGSPTITTEETNTLQTFMNNRDIDLSHGLDFHGSNVKVNVTYLDHDMFSYGFTVKNETAAEQTATIRVFLAPKFNELDNEIDMNEYRTMNIELDKFTKTLPVGSTTFHRGASQSSVTIPWEQTIESLNRGDDGTDQPVIDYCGCGWPSHLLIPKGTIPGMTYTLFVMVTDWTDDEVPEANIASCASCAKDAASYCGLLNKKYPDKKNMGYPFDKPITQPPPTVNSLDNFVEGKCNMFKRELTIQFRST